MCKLTDYTAGPMSHSGCNPAVEIKRLRDERDEWKRVATRLADYLEMAIDDVNGWHDYTEANKLLAEFRAMKGTE
jgi:hypothetical protein